MTMPVYSEEDLHSLLRAVMAAHPEQVEVIQVFTPLLLTRQRQLAELARREVHLSIAEAGIPADIPADVAYELMLAVLDAVGDALPGMWDACANIREQLTQAKARSLCVGWFANETSLAAEWAQRENLSIEALLFVQGQVCRILAAHAVSDMAERQVAGSERLCPYCGSLPELSVVHDTEGVRSLVCGRCSRFWRYRRTACPGCGHEAAGNLEQLYVEGRPEERGVSCVACKHYLLEVDIRHLNMTPGQSHILAIGLGHLDRLMQEEGFLPLSMS